MWGALGYLLYAAAAGDVVSTEVARDRPGIVEWNPLAENLGVRIGTHAAAAVAVHWGTAKMRPHRPKLALVIRVAVIAGWGYATVHNLRKHAEVSR